MNKSEGCGKEYCGSKEYPYCGNCLCPSCQEKKNQSQHHLSDGVGKIADESGQEGSLKSHFPVSGFDKEILEIVRSQKTGEEFVENYGEEVENWKYEDFKLSKAIQLTKQKMQEKIKEWYEENYNCVVRKNNFNDLLNSLGDKI